MQTNVTWPDYKIMCNMLKFKLGLKLSRYCFWVFIKFDSSHYLALRVFENLNPVWFAESMHQTYYITIIGNDTENLQIETWFRIIRHAALEQCINSVLLANIVNNIENEQNFNVIRYDINECKNSHYLITWWAATYLNPLLPDPLYHILSVFCGIVES